MENTFRLVAALALCATSIATASAQGTASATASATVVTPITIAKTTDMSFGNVAVNSTSAGTVVMTPSGARSAAGGVSLPASTGNVGAAVFTVSGQPNYVYAIALPTNIINIESGAHSMNVSSFTSSPAVTGTLSSSGTDVLSVSATLSVAAGQAPGMYTSSIPFGVTVVYN